MTNTYLLILILLSNGFTQIFSSVDKIIDCDKTFFGKDVLEKDSTHLTLSDNLYKVSDLGISVIKKSCWGDAGALNIEIDTLIQEIKNRRYVQFNNGLKELTLNNIELVSIKNNSTFNDFQKLLIDLSGRKYTLYNKSRIDFEIDGEDFSLISSKDIGLIQKQIQQCMTDSQNLIKPCGRSDVAKCIYYQNTINMIDSLFKESHSNGVLLYNFNNNKYSIPMIREVTFGGQTEINIKILNFDNRISILNQKLIVKNHEDGSCEASFIMKRRINIK